MTSVLDLATDLEDLVGPLDAVDAAPVVTAAADDRPPLVRPLAGLTTPVWYL